MRCQPRSRNSATLTCSFPFRQWLKRSFFRVWACQLLLVSEHAVHGAANIPFNLPGWFPSRWLPMYTCRVCLTCHIGQWRRRWGCGSPLNRRDYDRARAHTDELQPLTLAGAVDISECYSVARSIPSYLEAWSCRYLPLACVGNGLDDGGVYRS